MVRRVRYVTTMRFIFVTRVTLQTLLGAKFSMVKFIQRERKKKEEKKKEGKKGKKKERERAVNCIIFCISFFI